MSNRRVVVLSGVSGAGKTVYACKLLSDAPVLVPIACDVLMPAAIVSNDNFFVINGVYRFDPKKYLQSHHACFGQFIDECQAKTRLIVVDNVNATVEEIAPYVLGGEAYGYDIEIVTLAARIGFGRGIYDVLEYCALRNVHGVQSHVVVAQHKRIVSRVLPVHWKHSLVPIVLPALEISNTPVSEVTSPSNQWVPRAMKQCRNE